MSHVHPATTPNEARNPNGESPLLETLLFFELIIEFKRASIGH